MSTPTLAFSYLRVSSQGQAAEGRDGFDRQRTAIDAYAALHGAEIAGEFTDAVSGAQEWGERPGFLALLDAIFANGVRTIVVENLTRLARSVVVQENCITYLASKGISIISADTGENVTEAMQQDPMRRAIVQMQAVFAELEKASLVRKLRVARERKRAEHGKCEGRPVFGCEPEEEAAVLRMQELRRKPRCLSYERIAKALNDEGFPTKRALELARQGKPTDGIRWKAGSVQAVLKRVGKIRKANAIGEARADNATPHQNQTP